MLTMKIFYRVVAPWVEHNEYGKTIASFDNKEEAKQYVRDNSIHNIPFDPRYLTIETRVKTR